MRKKSERRSFPILETNSRTDRIPSHSHCEPRCLGNTSGMIISRLIVETLVRWKVRDALDRELFRSIARELLFSLDSSARHPFFSLWPVRVASVESGRTAAGSTTSHPTAYHFRGLPFSATTHTPAPSLCVGAHPSEVALFFAISCFSSPNAASRVCGKY